MRSPRGTATAAGRPRWPATRSRPRTARPAPGRHRGTCTGSRRASSRASPRPSRTGRRAGRSDGPAGGYEGSVKIVLPGGSGQVGQLVARAFSASGDEVVVLSRGDAVAAGRAVPWDARTLGPWAAELDGADLVLNLAGRSVNCRYTAANLRAMMDSRVESTRIVGEAIARASRPPGVWLQMSTATIYAHRMDAANDEATGIIGGREPDVPGYWEYSVRIARAWEEAFAEARTPATRRVALRTAMVMSPDRGGVFDVLMGLVRRGLGGPAAGGRQFVSWIHDRDFVRAVRFLHDRADIEGAVSVAAPTPLPQRDLMRALREV